MDNNLFISKWISRGTNHCGKYKFILRNICDKHFSPRVHTLTEIKRYFLSTDNDILFFLDELNYDHLSIRYKKVLNSGRLAYMPDYYLIDSNGSIVLDNGTTVDSITELYACLRSQN